VVLARTTDALRPVALSCADFGVPIDGPDKLFEPTGARLALEDHLRLALAPTAADEALIQRVCQTPARGLSPQGRPRVVESLRAGDPFETAFADVDPPTRGKGKLWAPGELFAALAECGDASDAIALLRGAGGFDEWFEDADRMGGLDVFECEVLEHAQRDASGISPHAYLTELEGQAKKLKRIRDSEHGIQLSTIHKSKGQQWAHVILIACDEGTLPHKRSLDATDEEIKRGEGIEAERRLAYVAFTRTQQKLEIHHEKDRPSCFLTEATLIAGPIEHTRAARTPPPVPGLPDHPQDPTLQAGTSLREILKRLVSGD
jgi:superfamily I DNA/RNA helicase